MKEFKGIHKDTYSTIFGLFRIIPIQFMRGNVNSVGVRIDRITNSYNNTIISSNKLNSLHLRWFPNKTQALIWLLKLEKESLADISNWIKEV